MPTQRTLTALEYIDLTDHLAKAAQYMLAGAGTEDTSATAAYQARLARDAIVALDQSDEYQITVDLAEPLGSVVNSLIAESALASYFSAFNTAITRHLGAGGLDTILTAEGVRVHSLVKRCINRAFTAALVFPPITTLATVAVTAEDVCTATLGTPVDTNLYGGAQIALEVTGQTIGAASIDVTVDVTLEGGTTDTLTGTITNGTLVGVQVELGDAADRVVAVTGVTIDGGTNGDDFSVVTLEDRTI